MSFNINGFQYGRGVTSTYTQGGGITTVIHSYKSTDSLATITTPGYFPPNIDGTNPPDKVFLGDLLVIVSEPDYSEVAILIITGLDPFTVSPSPFSSGNFQVNAPINATDNFGLQIVEGDPAIFTLEYATLARPGIVNVGSQFFGGNKIFTSLQITTDPFSFPLEYYIETSYMTIFQDGANVTPAMTIFMTRFNKTVTLHALGAITFNTGAAPGAIYQSASAMPIPFRPADDCYGTFQMINNGTGLGQLGIIEVGTGGIINLFWDPEFTTTFPAAVSISFFQNSMVYQAAL